MNTQILGYVTPYYMLSYFFIYGFLGWCIEVIYATLKTGKFVNRGFLNGPICPIYGFGMTFLILLLNTLSGKWWLLFLGGAALATLLELITGFVLEKAFKTKWWDYSKEHFNFKGYVCLRFTIIWGIATVAVFYTVVPLVNSLIALVPFYWMGFAILLVLFLSFTGDMIIVVVQLKHLTKHLAAVKASAARYRKGSDAVGEKISEATVVVMNAAKVASEKIKKSRLGKAFPKLGEKNENVLSEFEKAQQEAQKIDERNAEK